jgi:23S rRNA (adenine2503-C2)-methyltransferase
MAAPLTRYDHELDTLTEMLGDEPGYRARQVWDGLHQRLLDPEAMTELPKPLRERLTEALPPALELVTESVSEGGETVKSLWKLGGGAAVETVLMLYPDRATVCVSTQAGCAMGCGFCATGQAGFERHLTRGEIVEQVVRSIQRLREIEGTVIEGTAMAKSRSVNTVFMGMGEPFANYDNVWAAVERLHGAIGMSARHITISTVGVVPGIRRLTAEQLPVNLAVSLHAANDALRDELVPINRRYPLGTLGAACRDYLAVKNRRLSFEWALIDGVNDRRSDAVELAEYARSLRAHVNLIPLNPTPGYATKGTSAAGVRAFRDRLTELGANATIRRNRGTDIDAACGQLRAAASIAEPKVRRRAVNVRAR